MITFFSRLLRTIVSGKGILLIVSLFLSWFIVSLSRNSLSFFYNDLLKSENYPYMIIMFLPLIGFLADLFFEWFYSRTTDLSSSATLVLCLVAFIISYFGVTLLAIADVGSYLFSIILFIAPTTVILYKSLMVLMEVFYRMRTFVIGTDTI